MKLVLGVMEVGRKVDSLAALEMLNKFKSYGYLEIDSASLYGEGRTEKILGQLNQETNIFDDKNFKIATKVNPNWMTNAFKKDNLMQQFYNSLKSLNVKSVDTLYLHWPDSDFSDENIYETLLAINELYELGLFKRFGLSNYSCWQVSHIYNLCQKYNFITPSVYQGMYNMLTRNIEKELLPCLKHFKIDFYAYNPLAGGILSGRYNGYEDLKQFDDSVQCRFFGTGGNWAKAYQDRFWKKPLFDACDDITKFYYQEMNRSNFLGDTKFDLLKTSFSWLKHHSLLKGENDAIIIGCSSIQQFESNMTALINSEPLPSDLVSYIDKSYETHIAGCCPNYFR